MSASSCSTEQSMQEFLVRFNGLTLLATYAATSDRTRSLPVSSTTSYLDFWLLVVGC